MTESAEIILILGCFLILGLAADYFGRHSFLPRVTLLLLLGILAGPEVLDIIPAIMVNQFSLVADMTLLMVGFLLGGKLTRSSLLRDGRQVLWISTSAVVVTVMVVFAGLWLAGLPPEIAIILGCIASATAPAATIDVVEEGGSPGPFSDLLLSIVAVDDAWGLLIFSLGLTTAAVLTDAALTISPLNQALYELGGSIILGAAIGFPAAYLTGRLRPGEPMLSEALGMVFLCGGLALWLEVSYLIAAMVMGAVVSNFARHHEYAFHEIRHIEWSFMIVFFLLAGAMLDISAVQTIGLTVVVYVFCRVLGKVLGAGIGASLSHAGKATREWIGLAMLPQAGVALGMALVATNQFPEYRQVVLSVVISTTILFELAGPVITRLALRRAGSAPP